MSSNSHIENYKKAVSWAQDNFSKNPSGKPPTSWFWAILAFVLFLVVFVIYIKYFAIWENCSPPYHQPLQPIDFSRPNQLMK